MNISFLFLFITVLFAIGCSPEEEEKVIVTATLKGPSAMAMIHMIDHKDTIGGYAMQFIIKNEPSQVQAMILEESVDFAILPSTMGALLYNKTGNYILAGIPVWGTLYLFGSDTSIRTWNDLKGKKVSLMARGMTPDILFRYLAEKNGINPERDIKLDYSFPGHIELANAIAAGVSDLGVISEPLVSLVIARNPAVRPLLNFNEEWGKQFGPDVPFAQTALLVHREFAEKNPLIVEEYLSRLESSITKVNSNPETSSQLIVKYGILPDTLLAKASIPRSNLRFSYAWEEMKGIQDYFKVFYNFNPLILGGKLPDEAFFYQRKTD